MINMNYLKKLKDISTTQVLAKGLVLNDILKKDFLDELKSKLGNDYEDIAVSDINLVLIPPKTEKEEVKKDKKGLIIELSPFDFIKFEQPSLAHYKEKVVVITSNKKGKLEKVLK